MEPVTVEALKQVAALQGYAWSDEELERLRPQVERGLALVEQLGALVPRDLEPAIQYRMF
ncbi:MAG: hypothetical protein HY724_01975 [Candidatus Rokubacteria bacterium]|nr:hypothetical protein [Candidatus Rokubacteria bacterium]